MTGLMPVLWFPKNLTGWESLHFDSIDLSSAQCRLLGIADIELSLVYGCTIRSDGIRFHVGVLCRDRHHGSGSLELDMLLQEAPE